MPTSSQDIAAYKEGLNLLKERPNNFDECVKFARNAFEHYFNHAVKQLLHVYPLDAKTADGTPFWTLPKRPPTPLIFDYEDMLHLNFICSTACLQAKIFKIKIPSDKPRSDDFKKEVGLIASKFKVDEFVPDESAAKEIQASVDKDAKKKDADKEEAKEEDQIAEDLSIVDDPIKLREQFTEIYNSLPKPDKEKSFEDILIKAEEFEKDDDANFHIDFMSSMGNCRAVSYKLDPMDWLQVKLKAGRIVPAMATTTASIAGL